MPRFCLPTSVRAKHATFGIADADEVGRRHSVDPSDALIHGWPQPPAEGGATHAEPSGRSSGRARRVLTAAAIAVIILGALSRLLWLEDMEYKSDEREWVDTMVNLGHRPLSALAPESHHSGIPHSSGFFHFLRVISFASANPLVMVGAIAGFSAAVMLLGRALGYRSPRDLVASAMMSTSLTLFVGTRKIWTPDLIPAWLILGLVLWSMAERARSPRLAAWLTGWAAFCFVMAPHMYLSAIPAAAALTLALPLVWLLSKRTRPRRARMRAWVVGALAGWATFIPYVIARHSVHASSRTYPPLSANVVGEVLQDALTLPSPLKVFLVYLWPSGQSMNANHPSLLFDLTLFWVLVAVMVWTPLFCAVLVRLLIRWRQTLGSPMIVASLLAWMGTAAGILFSRLGSYINYWLDAVPFVYFVMAWAAYQSRRSLFCRILRPALWVASLVTFVATVHFAFLIHKSGGFPGEYGTSYRQQQDHR